MLESNDPKFEFINYYGNTNLFALNILRKHGNIAEMNLLSIACRMPHLADFLALFRAVHHSSMADVRLASPPEDNAAKFHLHIGDFFELEPLEVDCVISHAAIHCFNDTRYGNVNQPQGWQKPYRAPAKLREIVGEKRIPVIVSIAVNRNEGFYDDNAHLSHDKFVAAFAASGFALRDYYFDYVCGGFPQQPQYLNYEYRRSKTLPETCESPRHAVVGSYYFF
jgi:hypothetical protein